MILFGHHVIALFISADAADAARSLETGYAYLCVMSACLPVLYILYVIRSSIQGMGETVLPMVSGIAEFFARVLVALTLPAILGERGVYLAEVLAWLAADLILIPSYFVTLKRAEAALERN